MIEDKQTAIIIDIVLILATITIGFMLFIYEIPVSNKDIANVFFGALLGMSVTIVNYHRGSSHGSKAKDGIITDMKK